MTDSTAVRIDPVSSAVVSASVASLRSRTRPVDASSISRCTRRAGRWFGAQPRDESFGNARLARNLFESCVARQALRLGNVGLGCSGDRGELSDAQLVTLNPADVPPYRPERPVLVD